MKYLFMIETHNWVYHTPQQTCIVSPHNLPWEFMVSELCDEKTLECYETAPAEHLLGLCSIKTIISNWSDLFGQSATLMMISILFDGNLIRISCLVSSNYVWEMFWLLWLDGNTAKQTNKIIWNNLNYNN